jgi:hypothetical protein
MSARTISKMVKDGGAKNAIMMSVLLVTNTMKAPIMSTS